MEVYLPPAASFLPRPPPPKPVVPAVPLVPLPDLPDVLHAPEGSFTRNDSIFPNAGQSGIQQTAAMLAQPTISPITGLPAPGQGQTAATFGSTIVNGVSHPVNPMKMTWVSVYFPPKTAGDRSALTGWLGKDKDKPLAERQGAQLTGAAPDGYEPSEASDTSSPSSDPPVPPPMEIPLSAIPIKQRAQWQKSASLSALPRPKNNLRSSSSIFVTRLQSLEALPKIMAERGRAGGETVRWGFWNIGRTFGWGEEGGRVRDPLARVTFSQVPTCHTVSHLTASPDRLDIVVGFASGDLVWLDFILGRYTRINKAGLLNNTAVRSVHFDPRQAQHFTAVFADGVIMQFNLFAEDPMSSATSSNVPWDKFFASATDGEATGSVSGSGKGSLKGSGRGSTDDEFRDQLIIWKNEDFDTPLEKGKEKDRSPWAAKNPTAVWKLGKRSVTGFAYSPDGKLLSVVSDDGMMRLIDVNEERLTDTFAGYFSGLTCVCWSPDSRFIAVGGKDDLITIFSSREARIVARCQGHSAFVTGIAFDVTRGEGRGYRLGSVGEDGKLILWDFSAASLHRPRHHHPNASHHRLAAASTLSLNGQTRPYTSGEESVGGGGRYHPAPPRSEVALLQPIMSRIIEGTPLDSVHFSSTNIVTISRAAVLKFWQKPPRQQNNARSAQKSPAGIGRELRSPRMERDTAILA